MLDWMLRCSAVVGWSWLVGNDYIASGAGRWMLVASVSQFWRAVRSYSPEAGAERFERLTGREREIPKLFAEGLTYLEIGEIWNNALTARNAVPGF